MQANEINTSGNANETDFAKYVRDLPGLRDGRISELEAALEALLDDLALLEGSGPFVISPNFCKVNRERAQALLEHAA